MVGSSITFSVEDESQMIVVFKCKKDSQFIRVVHGYCQRQGLDPRELVFSFNNNILMYSDVLSDVGIFNEAIIKVANIRSPKNP